MKDHPVIFTIGYEHARLPDFVATLQIAGITILVDVRQLAASRKVGFSKNALAAALAESDIKYFHLSSLGDPKPGREAARAGQFSEFERIYSDHLATTSAQQGLKQLSNLMFVETVCIMCYERDPTKCHRSIVAKSLSRSLCLKVQHLGVKAGLSKDGFGEGSRERAHIGKGFASSQ